MARISSKAKAGFFPTPESVTQLLKEKLSFSPGARLLDPVCGKGKTLSALAKGEKVQTCGIELDYERLKEARSLLDITKWADSLLEMRISKEAFGLLFLNPPYDWDVSENGRSVRLENRFLNRYVSALQKDGWLILLIPQNVIDYVAEPLAKHFSDIGVYAFPEEDFWNFKQCIIVGRKSFVKPDERDQSLNDLMLCGKMLPDDFLLLTPSLASMPDLTIPAPVNDLNIFKSFRLDPEENIQMIRKAGLMGQVLQEITPVERNHVRPLSPLEVGHLSLMLAGGYMNGLLEKDGKRLVIKGSVIKEEVVNEKASSELKVKTRDQYKPTVKAIDINAGEMFLVQ